MRDKLLKKYESFVSDVYSKQLNENIFTKAKNKFKEFFGNIYSALLNKFGKKTWIYLALHEQDKGTFQTGGGSKIEVYSYAMTDAERKEYEEIIANATTFEEDLEKVGAEMERINVSFNEKLFEAERQDYVPLEHPDPEMENINATELMEILHEKFDLMLNPLEKRDDVLSLDGKRKPPVTQPMFIWGAPGIGKTDIIKQFAKERGCSLMIMHLSLMEPSDFIGIPSKIQDKDGINRTVFCTPMIFPTDNGPNDKGVIWFLDEMNLASDPVLKASQGLVLDGKLNEYVIPEKCFIVAAGNRRADVPSIEDMSAPLSNRFAHYNYVPEYKNWEKWALTFGKDTIHTDVMAFLSAKKEFFHRLPADERPSAWASPRSWSKASEYLMHLSKKGNASFSKEKIMHIFAPYVGKSNAREFANFLELRKNFDPKNFEKIYKDGANAPLFKMDDVKDDEGKSVNRIDVVMSVCSAIASYKRNQTLTDDEVKNLFDYALRMPEMEIATAFLGLFKQVHPYLTKNPVYIKGIENFHNRYRDQLSGDTTAPKSTRKKPA